MIFSLVIAALVLGIAYFHWVQGLLSGIISMVLAVLAASLAVGYHEAIATSIMGGKMADMANGMMLCIIFAVVYGIGRIVFDSLIPGNVRLPLYLDSIGGGVCGLVVGIFAAGTFALAIQSMPFGPAVMMQSRYPIAEDQEVTVAGSRRQESAMLTGALEMEGAAIEPDEAKANTLMIPADSMVADFTAFQSESGALAGNTRLRDRHPNLVRELFFQRLGMETSAKRTALNVAGRKDISVTELFAPPGAVPQMEGENPSLNRKRNLPAEVKPDPSKVVLVVRINVDKAATDKDTRFRFSTGAVRIVADGQNITPVGVIYEPGGSNILMNYRVDDFLVAELDKEKGIAVIDLVFIADRSTLLADPAAKEGLKIKPGAFLEVKRLARVDLSEKDVAPTMPDAPEGTGMIYKKETRAAINKRLGRDPTG